MKLYCKCGRKNTVNKDKEWDFPLMKVVSIFRAECGALKRDTNFINLTHMEKLKKG